MHSISALLGAIYRSLNWKYFNIWWILENYYNGVECKKYYYK